ncbi:hypothetical protein FisN_16Hu121 [Fistulifera solaris]|uniref:Potassium channel tetramerisation-type BTB domain-containing protein n=1 Tax=Fistulifera solaris TaxID=1519565 RepID=A0A1Z5KTX3_FISSO|nr:hypothetical protein FisN_16Hu121 [Fistulifera solaris]|eukprot:GAX29438.1 hypothetical protein FisN_16Hu121 [Fistulifera solaris]
MPFHERDEEQEAALSEALSILPNLLTKRRKILDEREEELKKAFEKLEREKQSIGCGNDSDVIHLNVGGTLMATARSTLTYVESSMLAARFSGRWDESIAKDKNGNFFIDQPVELFQPLIDYIRNRQSHTPLAMPLQSPGWSEFGPISQNRKYVDFKRMVEYFGATLGIFPVELRDFTAAESECLAVTGPSSFFKVAFDEWKICGLVPLGHDRKITGFEVKIGEAVNLQIGWNEDSIYTNTAVGGHDCSIALDVARGGMLCNIDYFEAIGDPIRKGTVVKCRNFGKEWFIDGEKITGAWSNHWDAASPVPAISGKGEWTITAIEIEP